MKEEELNKVTKLFENMTTSIVQLKEKTEAQDKKIQYLENQLLKSLDLNSDPIETVVNRFETPIDDLSTRITELVALISSSTQVISLLKESNIPTKLSLVDRMFELLVGLPLINLKVLSIFMEFNAKLIDNSWDEKFIYTKSNQLQEQLVEYNTFYGEFKEETRQGT